MAPTPISDSQRGRRLLAAAIAIASLLAAFATLLSGPVVARADNGQSNPPGPIKPSPTRTILPTESPTPVCDGEVSYYYCPSPSPSVVVVSPVAPDPSPSNATPSYLIGTAPSPSPTPDGTTTVSSPVPLGGGFVDQLPTPSQQASAAPTSDLAPHQSGLPLPFLAVGALLILGAVGSLIYAIAPREKKVFAQRPAHTTSPVYFTPYGPDSPGTNLLSTGQGPRPGPE
ncbi:MAG: hypothetical protein QOK05_3102 [Chloroflexota bacterium]|jgi:hypothetical protein|nr:hypothetical protein [Chloroflexota bacterium]